MSIIQHHLAIEIALDEGMQKLRKIINKVPEHALTIYKNKIKWVLRGIVNKQVLYILNSYLNMKSRYNVQRAVSTDWSSLKTKRRSRQIQCEHVA